MVWLTHGMDENENFLSIDDCSQGKTNLRCPYCEGKLTAKKGNVLRHHFSHTLRTCNPSLTEEIKIPLLFDIDTNSFRDDEIRMQNFLSRDNEHLDFHTKKIQSNLWCRKLFKYGSEEPTDFGRAVLKELTLGEYYAISRKCCEDKLAKMQAKVIELNIEIENLKKEKKRRFYREEKIEYRRRVHSRIGNAKAELEKLLLDTKLYEKSYKRISELLLYFLEVKTPDNNIYKIGITTRDINRRIKEVKCDLLYFFEDFSINLINTWAGKGAVERYFKHRYSDFNYPIGKFSEYFLFPDINLVLQDLNSLNEGQRKNKLSQLQLSIFDN